MLSTMRPSGLGVLQRKPRKCSVAMAPKQASKFRNYEGYGSKRLAFARSFLPRLDAALKELWKTILALVHPALYPNITSLPLYRTQVMLLGSGSKKTGR